MAPPSDHDRRQAGQARLVALVLAAVIVLPMVFEWWKGRPKTEPAAPKPSPGGSSGSGSKAS